MRKINWILMLLISIISCSKDEGFDYPLVYTGEVTEINQDGALFSAKIVDLSKSDIIEYGFVWDSRINPVIESAEKCVKQGIPPTGVFSQRISTTLKVGVTYYVRTFARNKNYITYGQEVAFINLGRLAPQISEFTPKIGNTGDTITITGHNFSNIKSANQVKFGKLQANVLKSTHDTLIVKVPDSLDLLSSSISISVLGNETISPDKFNLIPPVFTDFYEKNGAIGSQVTLAGNNFLANPATLHVYFGDIEASIAETQAQKIIVTVPEMYDKIGCHIKVTMNNQTVTSKELFNFQIPFITDFYPKIETFGSLVTIQGKYFAPNPVTLHVFFDEFEAEVIENQAGNIVVKVPDNLGKRQCNLKVIMDDFTIFSTEKFQLAPLSLNDFTPKIAITGNTITLTGNNFSPSVWNNIVIIGGLRAEVTKASINELEVKLQKQTYSFYNSREAKVNVEVIGENHTYNETLLINDQWFMLKNTPLTPWVVGSAGLYNANCFVSNGKAYIGLNNTSEFWEYNPLNDQWTKLMDFPGTPRKFGAGFVLNNKIYFGTGNSDATNLKDWWEYNIEKNRWFQKNDFGGGERTYAVAFKVDNMGFLGAGILSDLSSDGFNDIGFTDFWKYTPSEDTWLKATDYPIGNFSGFRVGIAIANSNEVYIGLAAPMYSNNFEKVMYKYNSYSNLWQRISDFPHGRTYVEAIGFNLGGIVYIRTGDSRDFYYYNDSSDSWVKLQTSILSNTAMGIAFAIGGKAYVGLGPDNSMWEFDPSR